MRKDRIQGVLSTRETAGRLAALFLPVFFLFALPAQSAHVPHPVALYEQADKVFETYRGQEEALLQAEAILSRLVTAFPESALGYLGLSRLARIRACLYGDHYDMTKIREDALPNAMKALDLGPSIRDVHENYAHLQRIFENYQKQQEQAKQYLLLFPDSAQTYFVVADLMREQAELDKALEFYKESLTMDPSEGLQFKILQRLGWMYLRDYDLPRQAVAYYSKAAQIHPDHPGVLEFLGTAHLQLNEYQLAVQYFKKIPPAMLNETIKSKLLQAQALLAEKEGRLEQAIRFMQGATEYKSQNSALHYALGNLYYKKKDFESAYLHFRRVIDLRPQEPDAYYYAGQTARSLGRTDQAREHYQRFLQLEDKGEQAQQVRQTISELP